MHETIGGSTVARWLPALAVMLAVGITFVTSAGAQTEVPDRPAQSDQSAQPDGRHLYLRDCAWCHAPSGTGTEHAVGLADVGPAGTYYMLSTGRMPLASPDDAIHRSSSRYSADEIDAIVDHVRSLVGGPEVTEPDLAAADLAAGGETYRRECAACHSALGIGGALAFEGYAPSLLHSTPTEAAAAIVAGPGSMPTFRGQLSDRDVADIVAYIQMLQDPPTTGISVPGGRVGEGLVASVAGLGALVLAARWIGTRQ